MPRTGRQPLGVAPTETGRGPEGVRVVDQAAANVGHCFEAAVGMTGEPGNGRTVVHPPAVDPVEVRPDVPPFERARRARASHCPRVRIVVVDAEQERIDGRPLEPEGKGLDDDIAHGRTLRPGRWGEQSML